MSKSYSCLYTKHKTQKHKKWNDGKLVVNPSGLTHLFPDCSSVIQSESNAVLDTLVVSLDQVKQLVSGVVTDLEMEKYLIEIESEWKPQPPPQVITGNGAPAGGSANPRYHTSSKKLVAKKRSNGMQKLLNKKFRKPTKFIPKPLPPTNLMSRKRPLQPGEYLRQFNGNGNNGTSNVHNGYTNTNGGSHERFEHVDVNGYQSQDYSQQHPQHGFIGTNSLLTGQDGNFQHQNNERHKQLQGGAVMNGLMPSQEIQSLQHYYPESNINIRSAPNQCQSRGMQPNPLYPPKPNHTRQKELNSTQSSRTNQFVCNDFDPNSFYEEEDDEDSEFGGFEDDKDRNNPVETNHHSEPIQPNTLNWKQNQKPSRSDAANRDVAATGIIGSNRNEESSGNSMTNSDLLQLFCGGNCDANTKSVCRKENIHGSLHRRETDESHDEENDNFESSEDEGVRSGNADNDADDEEHDDEEENDTEENPFLEGLLRSEAELDQESNMNVNVNSDLSGNDIGKESMRGDGEVHTDDDEDAWNGIEENDYHSNNTKRVESKDTSSDHGGGSQSDSSSDCDDEPMTFDIDIPNENDSD